MKENRTRGFPLTRRRRQEEDAEFLAVLLVCGSVLVVGVALGWLIFFA